MSASWREIRKWAAIPGAGLLVFVLCLSSAPPAAASPVWLPPVDLSAPGKDAANPVIAMDDAGETVAIWERQSGTGHVLQLATRPPGSGFSAPVELSPNATGPDLAMTPGGRAVAVWRHFEVNSGTYAIQFASRPPGGDFSPPVDISVSETSALPQGLRVAVDPSGDAVVAWIQKDPASLTDPNQFFVDASLCPVDAGCSPPQTVSPTPLVLGNGASGPGVAIDSGGDAFVVWEYFDGADNLVQAALRSPGGSFTAPAALSPGGTDAFGPQIATDGGGDATAVWTQSDGTNFIIQASTRLNGGAFSAPETVSQAGVDASAPQVVLASSGTATAAWNASGAGGTTVDAAEHSPGAPWSAPEIVSSPGEGATFPDLAVGADGTALIAWLGLSGGENLVRAAIRSGVGQFSPPVGISATDAGFFHPGGALDSSGDATVVWSRSDGTNTIVQAAGYDADLPRLQDVSIPSSGTVGVPVAFSAKPFDVWPITSTSFAFGDGAVAFGGSATHVYATRGTYPVTVRAVDAGGTPVEAQGAIAIAPSGAFTLGKLRRNPKKGTATLIVDVSSSGRVVLFGRGVKRAARGVDAAGKVKLPVGAVGKSAERLKARGRARVRLRIAFTPDGGSAVIKDRAAVLLKKP